MSLDSKYTKEDSPRNRWLAKSLFISLAVFLIVGVVYGFFFFQISKADEQILTGQYSKALQTLHHWKSLPVVSGRVYERIGTAELLLNGKNPSEPYFRAAETKLLFAPVGFWQEVLKTLWTHARYEEGLFYSAHLQKVMSDQAVLRFYKAGFQAGMNQLDQAEKELSSAGDIPELAEEISKLRSEIAQRRSTGQYTFLYDRANLPIVSRSLKGAIKVLYEQVTPVLQNPSGDYLAKMNDGPNRQATTTLDTRIQNAAIKALEKYAGSIVLLDVKTGDILAAAGSLKGFNSLHPPGTAVATHVQYEPGSIIKMITLAGALERGSNPQQFFPMQCEGALNLSNNKFLYCWKAHNEMKDLNVATAVSCNIAFARMGLAMKPADLLNNLRTFGFDGKLQGAYLPLDLGKIVPGDVNDQYIANLSIGLDYLRMTPLHGAMVASAIANEGLCMMPRLLLQYRNLIGVPYAAPNPIPFRHFMSKQTASTVAKAMEEVVLHEEGTGRRAMVANLPIAMKTGTAGDGAKGYDAFIIGFAPVKNPKVAFAIVVEHSGKAEFEGARITRLFLESIQGYIQ